MTSINQVQVQSSMTSEIFKPEKDVKKSVDENLGSGVAPSPIDANKGRKMVFNQRRESGRGGLNH